MITCLPQTGGKGYGHAISCAGDFIGDEAFLLSIADHLFVSDLPDHTCFQQVIECATRLNASVSAVQATQESHIHAFGTVAGDRMEREQNVLHIREVIEKPTPTLAEQKLIVSGLRAGQYLAFFGIHVLQPSLFTHLEKLLTTADDPARVTLTDAVNRLLNEEDYYALEVSGRRFDLEAPFGLLHGQIALALKSPAREQIMADLIQLVAER
jgi:UTP--glucose-1-phosphate uridylyltransferase